MEYIHKIICGKALDVDKTARKVKIAISDMQSIDRDNDVFEPTAWDKSIKERGPSGANEVWHLIDHNKSLFYALSKFKELYTEGKRLIGISEYRDTFMWKSVAWPLYEAGDINQHSVGFRPIQRVKSQDKSHNIIKEADLLEGSAVLWGANPNTPALSVMKSAGLDLDLEMTEDEMYLKAMETLIQRIRNDKYHEDNKALLIIEILRFKERFNELAAKTATQPELKTTVPEAAPASLELSAEITSKLDTLTKLFTKN